MWKRLPIPDDDATLFHGIGRLALMPWGRRRRCLAHPSVDAADDGRSGKQCQTLEAAHVWPIRDYEQMGLAARFERSEAAITVSASVSV